MKTIAQLLTVPKKAVKVNLSEMARARNMHVDSFRLPDGSTAKLLSNTTELDCVVLKNGKVLTAKGAFIPKADMSDTYWDAIDKLSRRAGNSVTYNPTTDFVKRNLW